MLSVAMSQKSWDRTYTNLSPGGTGLGDPLTTAPTVYAAFHFPCILSPALNPHSFSYRSKSLERVSTLPGCSSKSRLSGLE